MRIEDRRRDNNSIMFKDLEVGSVFEHAELNLIMIKLDEVVLWKEAESDEIRNALCVYDADAALGGSSTSVELWHISPESWVIPVNAKMVIEE